MNTEYLIVRIIQLGGSGRSMAGLEIRRFSLVTCQAEYSSRVSLLIRAETSSARFSNFHLHLSPTTDFITSILCRKASHSFLSYFAIRFQQTRRKSHNFHHNVATRSLSTALVRRLQPVRHRPQRWRCVRWPNRTVCLWRMRGQGQLGKG